MTTPCDSNVARTARLDTATLRGTVGDYIDDVPPRSLNADGVMAIPTASSNGC